MKTKKYSNEELKQMSYGSNLSLTFIRKYSNRLDWKGICKFSKLPEDFIEEFIKKINWQALCESQDLSEGFISKYSKKVCWFRIIRRREYSKEFYIKNLPKIINMISEFNPRNECKCTTRFERNGFRF
jgi:hypothetical protein